MYECVDVYNYQVIVKWNFSRNYNVWKRCQCVEKRWKIITKRYTKLLMSDGKRCKCITNHWRTLECIVMHSKCIEMHSNANFVTPVFPKDGHKCPLIFSGRRSQMEFGAALLK